MQLNERSKNNLKGVNSKLVDLVNLVAKNIDTDLPNYSFIVTEGLRTLERQKELFNKGLSKTMNSKHLTGDAVDIAVVKNGEVTWNFAEYKKVADVFKKYAKESGVSISWGGEWTNFKDGPHFELK